MPAVSKDERNRDLPLVALLEAILFLSGEPVGMEKLQEVCSATREEISSSLELLQHSLQEPVRGLILLDTAAGYRLGTKAELAAFLEKLWEEEQISPVLSPAALETLAIIAVKQPVTRVEIEKIRGVNVDGVIENLLKRNLIKLGGRREGLGRPHLYVTTDYFLQYFGLRNTDELEKLLQETDLGSSGAAATAEP